MSTRLGVALASAIGYGVGYAVGGPVGMTIAAPPGHNPLDIRPITKREFEYEANGQIIGSLVGTILFAAFAAGSSSKREPTGVSGELAGAFHNPEFP